MSQAIAKLVARRSRGVLLSLNLGFAPRRQTPCATPGPRRPPPVSITGFSSNGNLFSANPKLYCPTQSGASLISSNQLSKTYVVTERLSLTLFTRPNIKKTESTLDPPELMRGRGMPVTGIRPTTIPTFTSTWNKINAPMPMQM